LKFFQANTRFAVHKGNRSVTTEKFVYARTCYETIYGVISEFAKY